MRQNQWEFTQFTLHDENWAKFHTFFMKSPLESSNLTPNFVHGLMYYLAARGEYICSPRKTTPIPAGNHVRDSMLQLPSPAVQVFIIP